MSSDLNLRLYKLLDQLELLLPKSLTEQEWEQTQAFRWRRRTSALGSFGYLQPITHTTFIRMRDLCGVDSQKQQILTNTQQFLAGLPANHVLLTGARGTGKSSLIKACLSEFADQGLRLIEINKEYLADIADIVDLLVGRSERFILFCDDLSFERDESSYKELKSILDGGLLNLPANVLMYATSNRRHLIPEYHEDNQTYHHASNGELHPGDVVEEKISLSERFGLWLSFYPPQQEHYWAMVKHWLAHFGQSDMSAEVRTEALAWALAHGSRSGRVAWQFACDYAGRKALSQRTHKKQS